MNTTISIRSKVRASAMRSNVLSAILFAASLCACSGAAEVPATPDMSELREAYEFPTADLDTTTANEVLDQLPRLEDLVAGFRAARYTTNGVDEGSSSNEKSESALRVQGSIRVTLRCPGEEEDPVFDAATNGSISMTLAVENNRIKSSVRALAAACVLRGELASLPIRVGVDGPIDFDLGGDVGLRDKWSGQLLMAVRGTLDIEGYVLEDLSALWTGERLEYLFERPNQRDTVVAELRTLASGDPGIGLRDRTRIWGCRQDGSGCVEGE
jgi:hypothetical protein